MDIDFLINVVGAAAALIAAACWLYASVIEVPDNIDTFVQELQRVSYWNGLAASASCIAAFFASLSLGLRALG